MCVFVASVGTAADDTARYQGNLKDSEVHSLQATPLASQQENYTKM